MKKLIINTLVVLIVLLTFQSCEKKSDDSGFLVPPSTVSFELLRSMIGETELNKEITLSSFRISGVVISDVSENNLPEDYLVMQQKWNNKTRGIILKMDKQSVANYKIGDSLVINIDGKKITRKEGPLMITGVTVKDINKTKQKLVVSPSRVSVKELNEHFDDYESTLINVEANTVPLAVSGEKLAGTKYLEDGSGSTIALYTSESAAFANEGLPADATFIGIPFRIDSENTQLYMRFSADLKNGSGPIYEGWPETFDEPYYTTKGSYNMTDIDNMVALKTGNWWLFQVILAGPDPATKGRDVVISGEQALRFQQQLSVSAYLQMNFDVPNGATKVSVWYGSYYNDASSTWTLESSTDQGVTWEQVGEPRSDGVPFLQGPKLAIFIMDIEGPVRFRINKKGLGPTLLPAIQNGRLGMDNFTIYQKF